MKKNIDIKSLALGALLSAVIAFSVAATSSTGQKVWEYKTVSGIILATGEKRLDDAINRQIAEGWEYVSASPSGERGGFAVLRREKR